MQIIQVTTAKEKKEFLNFPKDYIMEIPSGYASLIRSLKRSLILKKIIFSVRERQTDGSSKITITGPLGV
jgi:hypothetical protein